MLRDNTDCFYGKNEAQMIAGIATLLMVWHHLFTYSNWIIDGLHFESLLGKNIDGIVWLTARLGNICIYLFAFQSGYTIYKRRNLYDSFKKRLTRILTFLLSYWMVCISFWIFGSIFNEEMPTFQNALLNLFGIEVGFFSEWINVTFAWYVLYYVLLIMLVPLLYKCFDITNPWRICLSLTAFIGFILLLSFWGIKDYWCPFMASIAGILTAKYNLFVHMCKRTAKYFNNGWYCFILLLGVFSVRIGLLYFGKITNDEIFYPVIESIIEGCIALVFIFAFLSMMRCLNNKWLVLVLSFTGNISMFLWFLHSIIFTGSRFLQNYVYYPQEPIVVFFFTLVIFIPIAMGFKKAYICLKNKLFIKCVE